MCHSGHGSEPRVPDLNRAEAWNGGVTWAHARVPPRSYERIVCGIEVICPDDEDAPAESRQRARPLANSALCRVSRHASSARVDTTLLPDLLLHFTIYEAADSEDAAKRRIDHERSQFRESGS